MNTIQCNDETYEDYVSLSDIFWGKKLGHGP